MYKAKYLIMGTYNKANATGVLCSDVTGLRLIFRSVKIMCLWFTTWNEENVRGRQSDQLRDEGLRRYGLFLPGTRNFSHFKRVRISPGTHPASY
jgi:hypothetical protein